MPPVKVLGIDLGIASCGWAVIETEEEVGRIVACGVRCWEAPEVPKTSEPKNQQRRLHRGQRRVIRRRRQRMAALRRLFVEHGLLSSEHTEALKIVGLDPWKLRVEGLDRILAPNEFAVALGHIARHRGFRSNSKRDRGANAPSDTSKMLKALDASQEKLSRYRTVGEMLFVDPEFKDRRHNREGDYSRTPLRSDLEYEATRLFGVQRKFGSLFASTEFESAFHDIAFSQRQLGDSWDKVGQCAFELGERRTARHAYSFELFRFLSRLTSLRVGSGRTYRALTSDEICLAAADFGRTKKFTFHRLRNCIGLGDERFQGTTLEDERKRDVVSRSGEAAEGTVILKDCLSEAGWDVLLSTPHLIDQIGEILTFRDAPESIRSALQDLALDATLIEKIMMGVNDGRFARFRGAGHISAKAARNIIPHLMQGLTYDKAAAEAGYRHTDRIETEIANPVARKAVLEATKQIRAIVREFGVPDQINIELARDIGKSADERKAIENGIERRNKEKDKLRDIEFPAAVGRAPANGEELIRFELWKEQGGKSLYSDRYIEPYHIAAADNTVQVDHILPWSRFGDDSFHNKTLCFASENQEKKGRTPFEWFQEDKAAEEWEAYRARVETCKALRGLKKRNYMLLNAGEVEGRFKTRNLNDTRYAARALMALLEKKYPPEAGSQRVYARPGALTAKLRRAWGIDDLKKNPETGTRVDDDRHHALDAIVIACTTNSALQRLTRAFHEAERRGLPREIADFDLPWPSFVSDARAAIRGVFVSRAERRRARGKAHDATIKQIRQQDGRTVLYERKSIDKLTLADLDKIPTPEPHGRVAEPQKLRDETVAALRQWIEAGKSKDARPRSPKGDEIRKVRVATNANIGVEVRGGAADRGEMVRIDVFRKPNAKGVVQYFLVPIYPHEVAMRESPPDRAIIGGGDEDRWPVIDQSYEFMWSLFSMSLVEIVKSDGEIIRGYHRSLDRNTGALTVSAVNSSADIRKGIGARTLTAFNKLTVDRLGRVSIVSRETRTWRGKVCT